MEALFLSTTVIEINPNLHAYVTYNIKMNYV